MSTYEKEGLAILLAIEHWRTYLQTGEFVIRTDQCSLVHLGDQRLNTPWQQKVMTKLLGLQYRIVYKPGFANRAADALSRRVQEQDGEVIAISTMVPNWVESITSGYQHDPQASKLLKDLTVSGNGTGKFRLSEGILKLGNRVWVGNNVQVQHNILTSLHSSAIGGHSGFQVTYHRIRKLFAWPGIKRSVREFVERCSVCKQAKAEHVRYPGLLQPLPVPDHAWQVISMDFIEGLPRSAGFNCIMVIVDKFSKYAHFIGMAHPFTAFQVAQMFMQHVFKLHGLPQSIISDRDRVFTSSLWKELF